MTDLHPQSEELRFLSAASLRSSHSELRKRYSRAKDKSEFIGEIAQFIERGRATGTLLDDEDERWACQSVLDYWLTSLYEHGLSNTDSTLQEFDPSTAPELPGNACPYMGLDEFREENAGLFYGRQTMVKNLLELTTECSFVLVTGSSGSGKSSLVMAGLIPALKADKIPGSKDWDYLPTIVPGEHPNKSLSAALHASGSANPPLGITRIIVVDQFEEMFTLCQSVSEREEFFQTLTSFLKAGNRVIVTIRSDHVREYLEPFLERNYPNLATLAGESRLTVTPLSAPDLRKAIEAPARRAGLKFEKRVVDRLVEDLVGEPAGLPLLQFTLMKLWENRSRNQITLDAYNKLGGGLAALKRSADRIYKSLIPEDQRTARYIFLRLVQPGTGVEFTRRRLPVKRIYRPGQDSERIDRVLQRLLDARLIRMTPSEAAGQVQLEVVHESLLRNWPKLADWIEDERHVLRERVRLSKAGEEWIRQGKPDEFLYRGAKLEKIERVIDDIEDDLTLVGASFLQAGRNLRSAEEQKIRAQYEKERQLMKQLAEEKEKLGQQTANLENQKEQHHNLKKRFSALRNMAINDANELAATRKTITQLRRQIAETAALDPEDVLVMAIRGEQAQCLEYPMARLLKVGEKINLPCQLETKSDSRMLLALPNMLGLLALDENTQCVISSSGGAESISGLIATENYEDPGRPAQRLFDKGRV